VVPEWHSWNKKNICQLHSYSCVDLIHLEHSYFSLMKITLVGLLAVQHIASACLTKGYVCILAYCNCVLTVHTLRATYLNCLKWTDKNAKKRNKKYIKLFNFLVILFHLGEIMKSSFLNACLENYVRPAGSRPITYYHFKGVHWQILL
jgi:hypothetical protein